MTYPNHPGYKARSTARDAAAGIAPRAPNLRERVLDCLRRHPDGQTPEEIAVLIGEPVMNVRPRTSELSAKGLIVDSGDRRRSQGGRMAISWRAVRHDER